MKKIFTLCCAALFSVAMSAQSVKLYKGHTEIATFPEGKVSKVTFSDDKTSARLYKDGQLVKEYTNSEVDSVAFCKSADAINVDFTVGNYDAVASSKTGVQKAAVKTAWNDGDQVMLWLDGNTSATHANPNIVIKYDKANTKWVTDESATTTSCTPNASGTLKAIYKGDIMVATKGIDYTYNSDTKTLGGEIKDWVYLTKVATIVKGDGLSTDADKYTLSCDHLKPVTGFTVAADGITATYGTVGTAVTGISNDDGVAFVFGEVDNYSTYQCYTFTLQKDGDNGVKKYTAHDQQIIYQGKLQRINTTESKYYDYTEPSYVDLGLPSGTLWATYNVGANAPEDYGCDFSWGEVEHKRIYNDKENDDWCLYKWLDAGYICEDSGLTSGTFTKYVSGKGWGTPDGKFFLEAADDAATANWGDSWIMPSYEAYKELYSNCNWTWTSVNGIDGYKVANKSDESKYIFLPAAGMHWGECNRDCGSGIYWSSTFTTKDIHSDLGGKGANPPKGAVCLEFDGGGDPAYISSEDRSYGGSVRAVQVKAYDISAADITPSRLFPDGLNIQAPYEVPSFTIKSGDVTLFEGMHYSVVITNSNNETVVSPVGDKGTYTITFNGINGCTGKQTMTFNIIGYDLSEAKFLGVANGGEYKDNLDMTTVKVTASNGTVLTEGTDYTMSLKNSLGNNIDTKATLDPGKYTLKIEGISGSGNIESQSITFKVYSHDLSTATITGITNGQTFTLAQVWNNEFLDDIVVKDGNTTLTKDTHYVISISDGKTGKDSITETGSYTVTVAFTDYTIGKQEFTINVVSQSKIDKSGE